MAWCPGCKRDAPRDALHCPSCGRALGDVTLRDLPQDAIRRLHALRPSGPDGRTSTQVGAGARGGGASSLETTPDGGALAREVMARVAARTRDDTEPVAARQPAPAPPAPRVTRPASVEAPASASKTALEPTVPVPRPTRTALGGLPRPGEQVEDYLIEAEVGRGGMGRVYRAVHRITGQRVALKMLLPQLTADPRQMARFVNEAKMLARLEHRNLVPLLGFLRVGARAFIVMPFVEGITLEVMLRKQRRLSVDVAVDLFLQLCDGLSCVHAHAMLHRDLKPGNVIIREDGRVLLTDFGIARGVGAEKLTLTGMVVGTAEYLSPEEARGERLDDLRSDVYSLGVLLFEMLCGHVPFRHPSAAQVLMMHVQAAPPHPRDTVPDLPPALDEAVMRALHKTPAERFTDVSAFKEAVLRAVGRGTPPAPSPPPSAQSPQPVTRVPAPVEAPPRVATLRETTPEAAEPGGRGWGWVLGALLAGMGVALLAWLLAGQG